MRKKGKFPDGRPDYRSDCVKKYGISLPEGATPRDAWDALKGRGISRKEVYDNIRENVKPSAARKDIQIQEVASKYLNDKGISRYDRTPLNTDSWAEKKYYELMDKYDNGEKVEIRLNGALKQRLLSYIENRQAGSAKRILRMDSDEDTSAAKKYWDRNAELINSLSTTTPKNEPTTAKKTNPQQPQKNELETSEEERELEKKKAEAIAYFRAYVERKNRLRAEGKYEEREITSSTYERAMKRRRREVEQWLGRA